MATFRTSRCSDLERRLCDSTALVELGKVLNVALSIWLWFEVSLPERYNNNIAIIQCTCTCICARNIP